MNGYEHRMSEHAQGLVESLRHWDGYVGGGNANPFRITPEEARDMKYQAECYAALDDYIGRLEEENREMRAELGICEECEQRSGHEEGCGQIPTSMVK